MVVIGEERCNNVVKDGFSRFKPRHDDDKKRGTVKPSFTKLNPLRVVCPCGLMDKALPSGLEDSQLRVGSKARLLS